MPLISGAPIRRLGNVDVRNLEVEDSFLPERTDDVDVGSSTKRFKTGYFTTVDASTLTSPSIDDKLPLAGGVMTGDITNLRTDDAKIILGNSAGASSGTDCIAIGNLAGASNQSDHAVAVGREAGGITQGIEAVAVGFYAGRTSQGNNAVALGHFAGETSQGASSVSIGNSAGNGAQGDNSVAVGRLAGLLNQGTESVAVGFEAGRDSQQVSSVAIGPGAGLDTQGTNAVAIGADAGKCLTTFQGANSVAIGALAGVNNMHSNSIVVNATGSAADTSSSNEIRVLAGTTSLVADSTNVQHNGTNLKFDQQLNTVNGVVFSSLKFGASDPIRFSRLDADRIQLSNSSGLSRFYQLGNVAAGFKAAEHCLGANGGPYGCYVKNFYFEGTDDTVPGAGANNARCENVFVGKSGTAINYYGDASVSFANGKFFYYQGDRAGVGTNGLSVTDTTESTSITTGAIRTSGGIGVSKNLNVGGDASINGSLNGLTITGGHFAATSDATVANTTTETSIVPSGVGSLSVISNDFTVGNSFTIHCGGLISNLNNETLTVRIYAGATASTLLATVALSTIPASTSQAWHLDINFTVRQLGSASSAVMHIDADWGQNTDTGGQLFDVKTDELNATTFDTTTLNTISVTAQWGAASASNTITCRRFVINVIY